MYPSDDDEFDPLFTPNFGVSADLETGIMGVEHLVTCESINFPLARLDDAIEQVINFAADYEAGNEYVDPPNMVIGFSIARDNEQVRLRDLETGETLPLPADRTNELIEQLMEFRRVYKAGGCR
jgi:hypothetical protein